MKKMILYLGVVLCSMPCLPADVQAQLPGEVAIHGFGGWAYGITDNENQYLTGNEDGNYDTVNFSLNLTATPSDRLSVHVQTAYNEGEIIGSNVNLDYAFAEWYFSDHLRLRTGKVKAPFMLYTEIYDVGTLRPFFSLPQGVYQEYAAEAYKGLGLTGELYSKGEWELRYDVYGGQLSLISKPLFNAETFSIESFDVIFHDMLGGRLMLQTPLNRLTLGVSAYNGRVKLVNAGQMQQAANRDERNLLIGLSLEYLSDVWWIRNEYLLQRESETLESDIIYFEAAYRFSSHWQVSARYEWADFEFKSPEVLFLPSSFVEHEEFSFGLNYWWDVNLVVKFSYHLVNGNRFAFPENADDFMAAVQEGKFEDPTHLLVFGAQFSF